MGKRGFRSLSHVARGGARWIPHSHEHFRVLLNPKEIGFRHDPTRQVTTQADFTYSITPDTISITDTNLGKVSVTNDIEAVLRNIEYWHQGSIAAFKIMYRDENGVWDGVRWDGQHPAFFAIGEKDEGKAMRKLPGMEPITKWGRARANPGCAKRQR